MTDPRSLVLITVDCFRADHAGFLGYARPTSPFLDCLAKESIVFRNAIVAGAPTYYSVPAILASRHPLALGRDLLGVAPDETTIASTLQESGFATAAFTAGNPYISERFGFARGFCTFRDFLQSQNPVMPETPSSPGRVRTRANQTLSRICHALPGTGAVYDELYFHYCQRTVHSPTFDSLRRFPSADVIVGAATDWLRVNRERPFFLWLHLMDPHGPYFPKYEALQLMGDGQMDAAKASFLNSYWARGDLTQPRLERKKQDLVRLYDAGIRWADTQIKHLSEMLVELNLWDSCVLAVTADHGEEFLDHGGRSHAPTKLTEELIHVPLLLRVPGHFADSVDAPVGLLDLAPTLLDVLDLPIPADFRGRSLWKSCLQRHPITRPVISECVRGSSNPFRREHRAGPRILAVRKNNYKLVMEFPSGRDQLFDVAADPGENHPLSDNDSISIRRELLEYARKHVAESYKSRDFDSRRRMQLSELRLEWAHSMTRELEN